MIRTNRLSVLVVALCLCVPVTSVLGAMDTPGSIAFDWLANNDQVISSIQEIPGTAVFAHFSSEAFFSSDASSFGEEGALIWSDLMAPDGETYGILLLDLDLTQAPVDGDAPVPVGSVRAEYFEKQGDNWLFRGEPILKDVRIVDVFFHGGHGGGVEGIFNLIFTDPSGGFPGCRVLANGHFSSNPSPREIRRSYGIGSDVPSEDVYVNAGCSGDVVIVDDGQGCDCGGSDESAGCEGDTSGSSGCEGDSGGSGCEGDSGGGCAGDSADSCEGAGDVAGGCSDCSGAASAGVAPPHPRGGPLRAVMRMFPELSILLFISWMRRRYRIG